MYRYGLLEHVYRYSDKLWGNNTKMEITNGSTNSSERRIDEMMMRDQLRRASFPCSVLNTESHPSPSWDQNTGQIIRDTVDITQLMVIALLYLAVKAFIEN